MKQDYLLTKSKYFDKVSSLLKQAQPKLATIHRLEFKNCFGAVAGYVDGHIFISCGKFGLALKLPAETLTSLFKEKDVLQLRYFPRGHIKKEYAVIPQRIIDDKNRFKKLLVTSMQYALSILT